MKIPTWIIVGLAAATLAACGGDDDGDLRPAEEVRGTQAAATVASATDGRIGQDVKLGDLTVLVSAVTFPKTGVAAVQMKLTNATSESQSPPDLYMTCGSVQGVRVSDDQPGALKYDSLPAKSFAEGRVTMEAAKDSGPCVLTAKGTGAFTSTKPQPFATWKIP